jgi:hypothetical protein
LAAPLKRRSKNVDDNGKHLASECPWGVRFAQFAVPRPTLGAWWDRGFMGRNRVGGILRVAADTPEGWPALD